MAANANPSFAVAVIKPSDPEDRSEGFHSSANRIFVENETIGRVLALAYAIHEEQIADAPAWLHTDKYDIQGVPDTPGEPNLAQYQTMLQKLLADRFGLKFHREKRPLPVYALTIAKGGPKLAKSAGDPNGPPDQTGNGGTDRTVKFTNNSMADLVLDLGFELDRPIVDRTALAGRFDFLLHWSPNELTADAPNAPPGIFTALQEQLGLKLESVKAPVDVLVIDHIGRPSQN